VDSVGPIVKLKSASVPSPVVAILLGVAQELGDKSSSSSPVSEFQLKLGSDSNVSEHNK